MFFNWPVRDLHHYKMNSLEPTQAEFQNKSQPVMHNQLAKLFFMMVDGLSIQNSFG